MYRHVIIFSIFCVLVFPIFCQFIDSIEIGLNSTDWTQRDKALAEVNKNVSQLRNNEKLNSLIYDLIKKEIAFLKNLSNVNKIIDKNLPGEKNYGYGEYILGLANLFIILERPNYSEIVIDFLGNGKTPRNAILKAMLMEEKENTKILNLIEERYFSKEQYYVNNKSSYLILIKEYLEKRKEATEPQKEIIIKKIILDALTNTPELPKNKYLLKNARNCAEFFKDDPEIIQALEKSKKLSE